MKTYGYVRVSTKQQNIERQIRNIWKKYPEAEIWEEVYTGTSMNRKKWNALKTRLRAGDTCVFDSVSRMSRTAEDGFKEYKELFDRGVELIFLKEPMINTSVYRDALSKSVPLTGTNVDYILEGVNRYLMELAKEQIRLAFEHAEKEVHELRQRTTEGLVTAKLNGKQLGRTQGNKYNTKKSVAAKKIIREKANSFGGPLQDREVMVLAGVCRNTYYKYKNELRNEYERSAEEEA